MQRAGAVSELRGLLCNGRAVMPLNHSDAARLRLTNNPPNASVIAVRQKGTLRGIRLTGIALASVFFLTE